MYVVQVAEHLRQMLHTDSCDFMIVVTCKTVLFRQMTSLGSCTLKTDIKYMTFKGNCAFNVDVIYK